MVKTEIDDQSKATRFLGNMAVSILSKWFHQNKDYPYPDEATTDQLAREASKHNVYHNYY